MLISEVFGYGVENLSDQAKAGRENKICPFRGTACTKSSKKDPIGICSLSDGIHAASLCPVRFIEDDKIFIDAARLAFGEGVSFGVFPEVRILKMADEEGRKIGKVDYILGKIDGGKISDFAALEVQAAYFSGEEIRSPLKYFLKNGRLDVANSERRPDFRSSAQKRLIPQLKLKVPVFRRWGKKFFVVVDSQFFSALPPFPTTTKANSEVTWLSYKIEKSGQDYNMQDVDVIYSSWDDVENALREGISPEPEEILQELQGKLDGPKAKNFRILSVAQ